VEIVWRSGRSGQRHHQPDIIGRACRSELKPHRVGHSRDAAMQPDARPCPAHARKKGHPRRFRFTHGVTAAALDLCSRRSSAHGHLLCKQGSQRRDTARRWTQIAESKHISRIYLRILGSWRETRRMGAAAGRAGRRHARAPARLGTASARWFLAGAVSRVHQASGRRDHKVVLVRQEPARRSRPRPTRQCPGCVAWMGKSGRADIAARRANCC
jgi:hypothetical protein